MTYSVPYRDPAYLRTAYWCRGQSLAAIADVFGVDGVTILRWMDKHGIPRRNCGGRKSSPTDRELLGDVQRVEDEVGRFPSSIDYRELGSFSVSLVQYRFGAEWRGIVEKSRKMTEQ